MLQIKETFVNEDTGTRYEARPWQDIPDSSRGEIFKMCRDEYGRCVSKIYVDTDKGAVPVGWVFEGRVPYASLWGGWERDMYLRHVWVEVREVMPVNS